MVRILLLNAMLMMSVCVMAQKQVNITVIDSVTRNAIAGATVSLGQTHAITDSNGLVHIQLKTGPQSVSFSSVGYKTRIIQLAHPDSIPMTVALLPDEHAMEEVVVISSTRNDQRIENSPLKVEVLGREEMDEENTIKPANIASILGDISGIQIQQSSAISGNANVRIQGLDGKYTQIMRDGMPLFDGFSGGFGILSIPPLDLKQVELIKGSASTLYGGGAIGGLINIISRRPGDDQQAVFTVNRSTLKETNFNTYLSKKYHRIGYTIFAGYTDQQAVDVNKDVFSDVPKLHALVIHPRIFFYPDDKTTIAAGYTYTKEDRNGGDMQVIKGMPDPTHQYYENNGLNRNTADIIMERKIGKSIRLNLKGALSSFTRSITTSTHYFKGDQTNYFTEASVLVSSKHSSWVSGINFSGSSFHKQPSDPIYLNDYTYQTAGIFTQYSYSLGDQTTLEAGLRADHQNVYGDFLLPRLAIFHRWNEQWGTRLGMGAGYKVPDPLSPQITDPGIENILPLDPSVKAEHSMGYNAEVNYTWHWGKENKLFINHAFFLTRITDPVIAATDAAGLVSFSNADGPVVTQGFDTYSQLVINGWEIYAGITYTNANRKYLPDSSFMPLTPKWRMAFTVVKEFGEHWRIGLEGSYTGYQRRTDYSKTVPYFFMAAMVERKFGKHFSVVLNGENLLDFRQSKHESLYTGSITSPTFVPLWAPIDGRVINLSVRFRL